VSGKSVQTFDPGWHSAGADSVDLGNMSVPIPIRDVRLVRGEVGGRNGRLLGEFVLFGDHEPVRFERRQRSCRSGMCQIVEGGKRRPVGEAGFCGNDGGGAAHTARGDTDNVSHGTTQLNLHDFEVAVGCRVDGHLDSVAGFAANA
jgi:hypothetical protein